MMNSDFSPTQKRRPCLRNILWYGGFWLLFSLWLRLCLPESLMGWERHQLFRYSAEYLTFFSPKTYPILLYIQAFFTQFYLYPLLGAAVIGGLLVLGMGAWHRLTGRYWTGLVWAAFMLPLIPYFNLLWILVWLVLLGGGLLIHLRRLPTGGRLALTAACGLVGSLFIQENIVLAIVFWSIIGGLRTRSLRHGLCGLAAGTVGAGLGIGLICGWGYPAFYAFQLWKWRLLTNELSFIHSFPSMAFDCPTTLRILIYTSLPIFIGLPFLSLLPETPHKAGIRIKTIAMSTGGLVLLGSVAFLNLRYQMEDFFLVDRLVKENRWSEALDIADLAFFQRARPEATGQISTREFHLKQQRAPTLAGRLNIKPLQVQNPLEEMYLSDMIKICLLANKKASSSLFCYNGSFYFPLLFSENIMYAVSSYFMACYYTDNGLYAEALHLLYDFVTTGRISTAVLEPLLWNNVVIGDYGPCRKFIRLFEQSLFHKDIARRYTAYLTDTARTAQQPEIAAARTRLSTYNHVVVAYQPDDDIHFRLLHEPDNAGVYEYALALWMVYKNHERILTELPTIRQYYKTLPTHIQEAVLACFPPDRMDEVPEDIDPNIKARYLDFMQSYGLYQNGYTSFQKLKKGFENTYWYHLHFNDFKTISTQPKLHNDEI